MNEHDLSQALSAIADAGDVDEYAAWDAIRSRLAAERRSARHRRTYLTLAGLAVAGSAAAALVAVAGTDDHDAIRTVPPATRPDGPGPTAPPASTATSAPAAGRGFLHLSDDLSTLVPATTDLAPSVVLVRSDAAGNQAVEIYDRTTGDLVARPIAGTPFSYHDASLAPDGTLWLAEEIGDTTQLVAIPWGAVDDSPIGADGVVEEAHAPAVSPDGTQLAYIHSGVTVDVPTVVLRDLRTGNEREIPPSTNTSDVFDVDWSPDGTSLLVAHRDGGLETESIRADGGSVEAVAATITAVAATVVPPDVLAVTDEGQVQRARFDGTGEVTTLDLGDRVAVDIDADAQGDVVIVYADGSADLVADDGTTVGLTGAGSFVQHATI